VVARAAAPWPSPSCCFDASPSSGLCCAGLLAKYGYRVTVLESHYLPGGAAHSFEVDGYKFGEPWNLQWGLGRGNGAPAIATCAAHSWKTAEGGQAVREAHSRALSTGKRVSRHSSTVAAPGGVEAAAG
jgi:glycine/D-amino acid oxidase-like deaminating enzyme